MNKLDLLRLGALLSCAPLAILARGVGVVHAPGPDPGALPQDTSEDKSLEAALAAVRPGSLAADIEFLASDALGGRRMNTAGARHAALYLRSRLQRLGLEPCGDDGYYDRFVLELRRPEVAQSYARLGRGDARRRLEPGQHYYFKWPADIDIDAGILWAGTGTRDELAEIDVRGFWTLVQEDTTPWRFLAEDAQAAGARGLLVFSNSGKFDRHGQVPAKRTLDSLEHGRLDVALEEDEPFPTVFLSRPQALFLLTKNPRQLGERLGDFHERRRLAPPLETIRSSNVVGLLRGSDPELRREVVVLTAHYDHLGGRAGALLPGANSNASGTAALLALAEALAEHGPLRRSVLFLFVSAGVESQLGARAWAGEPTLPAGYESVCVLDLDAVGGNAPEALQVSPTRLHEAHNGLVELARRHAGSEGFSELEDGDSLWSGSDHYPLHVELGIPALLLSGGPTADSGKPTDTPERVDADKASRVARLALRIVMDLQEGELGL